MAFIIVFLTFSVFVSALSEGSDNCAFEKCPCDCCFTQIPGSCTRYCFCGSKPSKTATEIKCRDGQVFDPDLQICQDAEGECPDIPPSGLNCKELGQGLYPHPTRCDVFIQCDHGYENVFQCPAGLHFCNKCEIKQCEWPYIAQCEKPKCEHNKLYGDDNDCSRYYRCSHGVLETHTCGTKMHFCATCDSPACLQPDKANCVKRRANLFSMHPPGSDFRKLPPSLSSQYKTEVERSWNCTSLPDGIYSVRSDATLYMLCREYRGNVQRCPPGHAFHWNTKSCTSNRTAVQMTKGDCFYYSANGFRP